MKILINETAFQEFAQDFYQLQMEYEALRQQKAIEKKEFIQDKYAETLAKVYVEFGKTVAPVVQAYADTLKTVIPSSECDQDCLIDNCFMTRNPTETCFAQCRCNFDVEAILEQVNNTR